MSAYDDAKAALEKMHDQLKRLEEAQADLQRERELLDEERSAMNTTFDQFARQVQALLDQEAHRRDVVALPGMTAEQLGEAILALIPGDGDW